MVSNSAHHLPLVAFRDRPRSGQLHERCWAAIAFNNFNTYQTRMIHLEDTKVYAPARPLLRCLKLLDALVDY